MTQTTARTGNETRKPKEQPQDPLPIGIADDESRILLLAVEHTADSVLITDRDGKILYANPAFENLTGYDRSEVIDENVSLLRSGHHSANFYARLSRVLLGGRVFRAVFTSKGKDGRIFREDKTITPIKNAAGDVTYTVSTGRDVSGVQTARDLELRVKVAEEAERFKVDLLRTISHELRTPLTAILSYTTAIMDYGERLGPDHVTEYLQRIENRTRQLERLISDLLTMSGLESAILPIEFESAQIQEVIAEAIQDWSLRGSLDLGSSLPAQPLVVHIDALRIREVLQNLLENAEKYSGSSARVTISARPIAGELAEITVRDYGPGLRPEEIDAIFKRFYRASAEGTAHVSGAGLGLAICKGIVEAHGGTIRAHLPSGGGLAVSFTVRREQAQIEPPQKLVLC
ncbi:MAG TPA: ATP-binding protein [Dehalococcoidia bacterium]|nr:ATP-binding protein [Dehalococcoidia bacterium]